MQTAIQKQTLAFIDLETTGLNIEKHEIIEIGGVLAEQDWNSDTPKFKVLEEFELKVKPEHIETADPAALRINRYDPSQWLFAYTLPEALKMFSEKVKGAIMVSHNVSFDYAFLAKAFAKTDIKDTMHYHKLDTISIAFSKLHKKGDVDALSLNALAKYFGVENEQAHSALPDARTLFEIYQKLMELS
jgi:DNA polymerase III subunit epsilon